MKRWRQCLKRRTLPNKPYFSSNVLSKLSPNLIMVYRKLHEINTINYLNILFINPQDTTHANKRNMKSHSFCKNILANLNK